MFNKFADFSPKMLPTPGWKELESSRQLGTYWNPTKEFVTEMADWLRGKKVLEIFAGNGLMSALLSKNGVEMTPTSILSSMDAHRHGMYCRVADMDACLAVEEYGSSHDVLLMVWPTVTPKALQAAMLWGKEKDIVFVGEVSNASMGMLGGCATDEFFESVNVVKRFSSYGGNMLESAFVCRVKESV